MSPKKLEELLLLERKEDELSSLLAEEHERVEGFFLSVLGGGLR